MATHVGAAGIEAVRCELEGTGISFFGCIPDYPDLVRGVLEKEAVHIGDYVRVVLVLLVPQAGQDGLAENAGEGY